MYKVFRIATLSKIDTLEKFYRRKGERFDPDNLAIKEIGLTITIAKNPELGSLVTYCKINCPINPLPARGWFPVSSYTDLYATLINLGWKMKSEIRVSLFSN